MPTSVVTGPDGKDYEVTHPTGASDAEVLDYAKQNYGGVTQIEVVQTGERYPGSLASPEQARSALRGTVKGTLVGGGAAVGAGLGATSLPVTGPAGPLIGASVGAGTGVAAYQALERFLPQSFFGPSEQPKTLPEQFKEIGQEALAGPMYEMGGRAAFPLLEKTLAPMAGKITQGGQRAMNFLRSANLPPEREPGFLAKRLGLTTMQPAPTDVVESPNLRRIEGTAAKAFGGGRIATSGRAEVQAVRGAPGEEGGGYAGRRVQELLQSPGYGSPAQRGEAVIGDLRRMVQNAKDETDITFALARSQQTGIPDLAIDKAADAAAEVLRKGALRQSFYQRGETSAQLRPQGGEFVPGAPNPKIQTGVSDVSWPEAPPGTQYNETTYMFDPSSPGPTHTPPARASFFAGGQVRDPAMSKIQAIANMKGRKVPFNEVDAVLEELGQLGEKNRAYWYIKGGLKDDVNAWTSSSEGNRAVKDVYRGAIEDWKQKVLPFREDQPLGRLVSEKAEPVRIMDHLLAPRDVNINTLRALRAQTGGTGTTWTATQEEALTRAIQNPRSIDAMGPETRKTLLTPETNDFLTEFRNWSQVSRSAERAKRGELAFTGQGTVSINQAVGGLMLLLRPLGGAAAVATAGQYTGHPALGAVMGGTVLIAPNVVARLLTNPVSAKWLTEGFRVPPGSAESLRIGAQLLPRILAAQREGAP